MFGCAGSHRGGLARSLHALTHDALSDGLERRVVDVGLVRALAPAPMRPNPAVNQSTERPAEERPHGRSVTAVAHHVIHVEVNDERAIVVAELDLDLVGEAVRIRHVAWRGVESVVLPREDDLRHPLGIILLTRRRHDREQLFLHLVPYANNCGWISVAQTNYYI